VKDRVVITGVSLSDLPALLEIDRYAPDPWDESSFRYELTDNKVARYVGARLLGGRGEHELVGFAGVWILEDEAHVSTIAVSPDYRGIKIGTRLFLALVEIAQKEGCRFLTLEVRSDNEEAIALYRRFGFVMAGRRARYYDADCDALIMWAGNIQNKSYKERLLAIRRQVENKEGRGRV